MQIWITHTQIINSDKNLDKSFVFFIGNFKISTIIYENQLFSERTSKIWTRLQKIIGFSKENWHRGGTEKIEKSAGRAASAIGVLRIFKSGVFAWRFFDFFRIALNETFTFERKWHRGGSRPGVGRTRPARKSILIRNRDREKREERRETSYLNWNVYWLGESRPFPPALLQHK